VRTIDDSSAGPAPRRDHHDQRSDPQEAVGRGTRSSISVPTPTSVRTVGAEPAELFNVGFGGDERRDTFPWERVVIDRPCAISTASWLIVLAAG
jgi:hypothetical protein